MHQPPKIVFRGVEPTPAVESAICARVERLTDEHQEIVGCTVTVNAFHGGGQGGAAYAISIDLSVPISAVIVRRQPALTRANSNVYVAVRDAFDAAERRMNEFREARRRTTHRDGRSEGWIARIFYGDGFGFIVTADDRHVYFHRTAVVQGALHDLKLNDRVEFVERAGDDGPEASMVRKSGPWRTAFIPLRD